MKPQKLFIRPEIVPILAVFRPITFFDEKNGQEKIISRLLCRDDFRRKVRVNERKNEMRSFLSRVVVKEFVANN